MARQTTPEIVIGRNLRGEIASMSGDGDEITTPIVNDAGDRLAELTVTLYARATGGDMFSVRMWTPGDMPMFDYQADVFTPKAAATVARSFLAEFERGA